MIFILTPSGTSFQHRIEKVHLTCLGEQLKGKNESGVCKTLIRSRVWHQDNFTSELLWRFLQLPLHNVLLETTAKKLWCSNRGSRKFEYSLALKKIHCVIPDSKGQVQTEVFSEPSTFSTTHMVHLQDEECQVEDIRGFVTCKYDKVMGWMCVTSEWQWHFFYPFGPSRSFMNPSLPDILWVPVSKMDPETATCHAHVISEKECYYTTKKLENRPHRQ
jgi:hypothetical protein